MLPPLSPIPNLSLALNGTVNHLGDSRRGQVDLQEEIESMCRLLRNCHLSSDTSDPGVDRLEAGLGLC